MGNLFRARTPRHPPPSFPWAISCCFPLEPPHPQKVVAKQILLIYKTQRIRTSLSLPQRGKPRMAQENAPAARILLKKYFRSEEAWIVFWEKNRTVALRIAEGVLRNSADAEEAVQNALMELDKMSKAGRTIEVQKETIEQSVAAYFFTIVRRRALDILRSRLHVPPTEPITDNLAGGLSPEDELLVRLLPEEIATVVSKLSPELAKCFLFYWRHQDWDWELWAKENGRPINKNTQDAYYQLCRRLRLALRRLLKR